MLGRFKLFRQERQEIRSEDLGFMLLGKFEREKRDIERKLSSACNSAKKQFKALEYDIIRLGEKAAQGYASIVKDKFCENALSAIKSLPPCSDNYHSMKNFTEISHETVNSISGLNIKEFRHLHAFAGDMGAIAEKIRLLESDIRYAHGLISASPMKNVDEINSLLLELKESESAHAAAEAEIDDLKKSIQMLKSFVRDDEAKISDLESGMIRHLEEKTKIRQLQKEMNFIKQKIDNEFSGLSRPMKKFLYYGDLSKNQALLLGDYIKSASDAFIDKDENGEIKEILEAMHRFRNRDSIDMDEERIERVEEIIRRFSFLLELREKYFLNNNAAGRMEEDMRIATEPIEKEIKELAENAESRRREMHSIESAIREKESESDASINARDNAKTSIESIASELMGRQVRIV